MEKYKNKDQKYHTQKVREFREEHAKLGLCKYCNEEAEEGKTMCEYHLNYYKFYKKFRVKKNGTKGTRKGKSRKGKSVNRT